MSPTPKPTGSHNAITQRRRIQASFAVVMLDFVIAALAVAAAYLIRFEGAIPYKFYRQMLLLVPIMAGARVAMNAAFGIYRMVWRYIGLRETLRFVESVMVGSAALLLCRLLLFSHSHSKYLLIPFGIIVIEGTFSFVGMAGTRFLPRILAERATQKRPVGTATLLVGAGRGAIAIAKEAFRHPDLELRLVGFLDDDLAKAGREIHGLPVLGTLQQIERVAEENRVAQLIITSAEIPPKKILSIMDTARALNLTVRIVPGLFEILGSKQSASALREVRIEDLLSRDPIPPSLSIEDLTASYEGKRVLVTGAGGSIGSELSRQLVLMKPAKLLLLERDETNLFEINRELRKRRIEDVCVPVLVDITNSKDLESVFKTYKPDVVFHAAAYKHVPMMEHFPWQAVRNNVFGTKRLIELSIEHGVESFVMISTDKAVNPTSVMGATKRIAEQVVQMSARDSETRFSCVRFGNVLGSRGSVVGIFREQIEKGGPVTVTHPEATRYFMTIPEAANLVIQAGTLGAEGEVFLLDMGEPVRILDLARQMIQLSGFTEADIPIQIVGSRPGEKLFEELRTDAEDISKTKLRKIFHCKPVCLDEGLVGRILERLDFVVRSKDSDGVRNCLRDLEIGYKQPEPAAPRTG